MCCILEFYSINVHAINRERRIKRVVCNLDLHDELHDDAAASGFQSASPNPKVYFASIRNAAADVMLLMGWVEQPTQRPNME